MISTAQHATAETVRADELAGRAPGNAWPAQRRKGPTSLKGWGPRWHYTSFDSRFWDYLASTSLRNAQKFQSWQFSVGLSTHRTNAQILLRLKLERGTDHEVMPLAKVNSSHHNRK